VGIDTAVYFDINAAVDAAVDSVVSIDKSRYGRERYREYDRIET
jgi:hypothetical protein